LKVLLLPVILVVMFLGLNVLQVGFDGLRVVSPGFVVSSLREAGVFAAFPDLMVGSLSWQEATAAQKAEIEAALRQAADPQWLETQVTLVLEDVSAYTKGKKAALTAVIPVNELFDRFLSAYAETADPAIVASIRQAIPAEYRQPILLSQYPFFPADLSALPQIHYWRLLPTAVGLVGLLVLLLALACLPLAGGVPGAARWTGMAFLLSGLVGVAGSAGLSRVVPSLLAGFNLTAPDPSQEAVVELAKHALTTFAGRIVGAVRSSGIVFLVIAIVLYILAAVVASARRSTSEAEKVETLESLRIEDAIYWYNQGCGMLGVGAQPTQRKAIVISQDDSFNQSLRQAVLCFDRALKIDPEYADAWVNKGSALFYLGRNEEALQCARKALAINPNLEAPRRLIETMKGS